MDDKQTQLEEEILTYKDLLRKYYPNRAAYFYKGIRIVKTPYDLWTYHEFLWKLRPKILIELGTERGASAMWFADQVREFGGRVISLDMNPAKREVKDYPGVEFVCANISDPATVDLIRAKVDDESVSIIHDANHETVYEDFVLWNDLVSVGSYFVVEDTTKELLGEESTAYSDVKKILQDFNNFEIDYTWNRSIVTCCFAGFLKRIK